MGIARGHSIRVSVRDNMTGTTPAWACIAYENPYRRYLLIQNKGDEVAEIGFGTNDTAPTCGMNLAANDNNKDFNLQDGSLSREAIYARSASGNHVVTVAEGVDPDDWDAFIALGVPAADISSSSSSSASSSSSSHSSRSASSASTASSSSSSSHTASSASSSSHSASSITASLSSASTRSASSASTNSSSSTSSYSSASSSSSSSTGP